MQIAQLIKIDVCPFRTTSRHDADCCDVGQTRLTIDTLPDDALLYVFDSMWVEAWHTLVHVCR